MTVYDLFNDILDMNESIEYLKSQNSGSTPDLDCCKAVDVLTRYRDKLLDISKKIEIEQIEVVVNGRSNATR